MAMRISSGYKATRISTSHKVIWISSGYKAIWLQGSQVGKRLYGYKALKWQTHNSSKDRHVLTRQSKIIYTKQLQITD